MPPAAVYFVKPLRMAAMPASLTGTGVSKSGSPEAKSITSTPRAAIALASAGMRSVGGGEGGPARCGKFIGGSPAGVLLNDGETLGDPGRGRSPRAGPLP